MSAKRKRGIPSLSDKRKFPYVLLRYDADGSVRTPTEAELLEVERRFPAVSAAFRPPVAIAPAGLGAAQPRVRSSVEKVAVSWQDECRKCLDNICKDKKNSCFFLVPVDPVALGIPEYTNIIKSPMDLGTVRHKLLDGRYKSPYEFNEDVCVTCTNAITFNAASHPVHLAGATLIARFKNKIAPILQAFDAVQLQADAAQDEPMASLAADGTHTTGPVDSAQGHGSVEPNGGGAAAHPTTVKTEGGSSGAAHAAAAMDAARAVAPAAMENAQAAMLEAGSRPTEGGKTVMQSRPVASKGGGKSVTNEDEEAEADSEAEGEHEGDGEEDGDEEADAPEAEAELDANAEAEAEAEAEGDDDDDAAEDEPASASESEGEDEAGDGGGGGGGGGGKVPRTALVSTPGKVPAPLGGFGGKTPRPLVGGKSPRPGLGGKTAGDEEEDEEEQEEAAEEAEEAADAGDPDGGDAAGVGDESDDE